MANTYKSYFVDLTTTNKTTIYTVPALTTAIVKTIQLTNESGSINVEVFVTDTSATTEYEVSHSTMSARSTENFAKGSIVLEAGDLIKIQAATANRVTGVISVLEISYA
jgi:hypothetical protein